MDTLKSDSQPCLGIMSHLAATRVYFINKSFFVYTASLTELIPYKTNKIADVGEYLYELLKDDPHPELTIYHPNTWTKKKKAKMNELLIGDDFSISRFMRFATLLM